MWKLHLVAFLFQMLLLSFEKIIKAFEKEKIKQLKQDFAMHIVQYSITPLIFFVFTSEFFGFIII